MIGTIDQSDVAEKRRDRAVRSRPRSPCRMPNATFASHGEVREKRKILEHHADMASLGLDETARRRRPTSASIVIRPIVGRSSPAIRRNDRGLAGAGRPKQAQDRTAFDLERHVVDGLATSRSRASARPRRGGERRRGSHCAVSSIHHSLSVASRVRSASSTRNGWLAASQA